MKNFFLIFIAACCLLLTTSAAAAEPVTTIKLTKQDQEPIKKDRPSKGNRMPGYTTCLIDLLNRCIICSMEETVLHYELWDENGETLLVSYPTDGEMTGYMADISGAYQLRLVTEEYLYIGYVDLN